MRFSGTIEFENMFEHICGGFGFVLIRAGESPKWAATVVATRFQIGPMMGPCLGPYWIRFGSILGPWLAHDWPMFGPILCPFWALHGTPHGPMGDPITTSLAGLGLYYFSVNEQQGSGHIYIYIYVYVYTYIYIYIYIYYMNSFCLWKICLANSSYHYQSLFQILCFS